MVEWIDINTVYLRMYFVNILFFSRQNKRTRLNKISKKILVWTNINNFIK